MKKQVVDITIPGSDACGTCLFLYAIERDEKTRRITRVGCSLYDDVRLEIDERTGAFCKDSICYDEYPEGARFTPE